MPSYALRVHSCEEVVWSRRKAPNLYVVIYQDGQAIHRTNAVKRNRTPEWDDLCNLSSDSPITLRLWHDCLLRCRDICLGAVDTEISALLDLASSDAQYTRLELTSEDRGSGMHTGTVLVQLVALGAAAAAIAIKDAQQDITESGLGTSSALVDADGTIENSQPAKTFEAGLGIIITKLEMIIHIGNEVAKIHPYANMAWKVLTSVYQAVKAEQATQEKLKKLVDTMVSVYSFTEETDALPQKIKSLEDKVLAIVKQTVECALFIREYSGHGFTARVMRNAWDNADKTIDDLSEALLKLKGSLEGTLIVQGVFLSAQVLQKVDHLVQSDALKTLNPAKMNAASRPTCLPGTRVRLLDEITEWFMGLNDTGNVLWLSGVAGSGKSTIATTVSVSFRQLKRLGAFLFFDRNDSSRSHPDRVIRTLASLLARSNTHIAAAIYAALEDDGDVIDAPLQTQFEALLLKPLSDVAHLIHGPILIVLDALDECGDRTSRRNLLSLISTEFPKLPHLFRFLITSRHQADINSVFAGCFAEKSVATAASGRDVQQFIHHELERIQQSSDSGLKNWPSPTQTQAIIKLADGLFIWAATAIRFIDGYLPDQKLETLITSNSTTLDALYSTVLRDSAPWDDTTFAMHANAVLGCIIFGKLPMTAATIDALLGSDCHSSEVLKHLRCVVQWRPGCVARILHASFADYLTDSVRNKQESWAIDMRTAHQTLSLGCLQILNTQLRFNICGLEDSHILNVDVPDISTRVTTNISPQLSYASCFWGSHLADSPFDQLILDGLSDFFHTYFLFWIEVLSLLGQVTVTLATLDAAVSYVKHHNQDLTDLITDTAKFVSVFAPMIAQSAPHIYLSSVPFTPKESRLAREFNKQFPNTLGFDSQLGLKWPAIQKVLQNRGWVYSVSFSPDGKCLASGSGRKIFIWETHTGQVVNTLQGHTGGVRSVTFSPDGSHIVSGSDDGTVRIWDAQNGALVAGPFTGHTGFVRSVVFSPDGTQIASGSDDGTVRVWNAQTGAAVAVVHTHRVWSVDFTPDGTQIASGSMDNTVCVWDAKTGALASGPFVGHTEEVYSVHFSPNGKQIASGSKDGTVRVWNTQSGALIAGPFTGHAGRVRSVNFSPDGTQIATGSDDHTIRIWDAQTGALVVGPYVGHTDDVRTIQFSPDGTRIASGSKDGTICVWDAHASAPVASTSTSYGELNSNLVDLSPDGKQIACRTPHGIVQVLDAQTGALLSDPFTTPVSCLGFSPDGRNIVSGLYDDTVCIWDSQTGVRIAGPLTGHTSMINSVTFSPDGNWIASGSWDKTICVWNVQTGNLVCAPLQGHTGTVTSVCFSPDGMQITSGSFDHTVRVWNAQTGELIAGPFPHTHSVNSVDFSPDGIHIVSGSHDNKIWIWNIETGTLVAGPFGGHTDSVHSVCFSPNGMYIATGSSDQTVQVWDAQTCVLVAGPFTGHTGSVISVHFSPDGTQITSSSQDGTIRVCQVGQLTQTNTSRPTDPSKDDFLIFDRASGWTKTRAGALMFWVPPWLREGLYLPHNTLIISDKGTTKLDFSHFVHGTEWTKCFDPKGMDTK